MRIHNSRNIQVYNIIESPCPTFSISIENTMKLQEAQKQKVGERMRQVHKIVIIYNNQDMGQHYKVKL